MSIRFSRLGETRDRLGESPLWDSVEQRLLWIDALAGILHIMHIGTGQLSDHPLPGPLGCIALNDDGRIVVAMRNEVGLYDTATRTLQQVASFVIPDDSRLNDGTAGPGGCFIVGSMHRPAPGAAPQGMLFRVDSEGRANVLDNGLGVVNGPCMSPDRSRLYVADSTARMIYRYDLTGDVVSNRQPFVNTQPLGSTPDGATVDEEGYVWTCLVRAGAIARFAPDGAMHSIIRVPTAHPTSLAFAGPALDRLVVTSISRSTVLEAHDELAGCTLIIDGLPVKGLAEPRCRLLV